MINKPITFLLIVVSLIGLCESVSLNSLSKQCLCDISDQCDSQCCCDSKCDSTFVTLWNNYKLCLDDSFGIPFCTKLQTTDINILDLHSGLRTIYSVIKRLFCINTVNFVEPSTWYDKKVHADDLQSQVSTVQSSQTQSVINKALLSLAQFPIAGLPLKGSNGLCRESSQITKNNEKSASCRVFVKDAGSVVSSLLSIAKIQGSTGALKKYDSKTVSSSSAVSSSLATSCTGINCVNVVRQLKILINSQTGSIDSNSYAVLGPMTIDQAGYISIDYQYAFVSTSNGQTNYPYSSKSGYSFGSRLNLLSAASSQYFKILNPVNIAFRKPDGSCRVASADQGGNSLIEINFGQNQVVSCFGSSNLIYQNLKAAFNYVGKYGVSSSKLIDYISVTFPSVSVSGSQSVQILFYYLSIGTAENKQYQIQKVEIRAVPSKDGLSSLYVEFISIGNVYSLYVPPAPIIDAYLPNDFLYPFYVA